MEAPKNIKSLHSYLKQKKYSAVDLVDFYLNRINKFDKNLSSFLTVSDDHAYKKAKQVDQSISNNTKAFEEFPLLGTVISLKDLFSTKGIKTTAASKVLESYVPAYSATVVDRLDKAGAIIIGKTNCDAWAHGASGENSDFGPTKNPWNTEYVPGGSSSGSAVSVAAQFSIAATGTDTGGSIRQPASFTNTVGLKPTYGAVSRYGVIAMASSNDSIGHFTHTVEDSEKIFNITKGPDGKDATVTNSTASKTKETYTLGIADETFEGVDTEVSEVFEESKKDLEKSGIKFKKVSLPHSKYSVAVYYIIQPAEVSSNLFRYDGVRYGEKRDAFGDEAKRRIMLGTYVLSSGYYDAYYLKAMKVRTKIIQDFDKAFEDVDAILSPVTPTPPFKLGEKLNDPLQMYLADILTVSANLAGIPGLALPAGFTNGLPVGVQLLGPRFSENILFDIGKKYQNITNWHEQNPFLK